MVEPEIPEHTNVWPVLPEKAIVARPIHQGKSATYATLLLESVDSAAPEPSSGGEQR